MEKCSRLFYIFTGYTLICHPELGSSLDGLYTGRAKSVGFLARTFSIVYSPELSKAC